MLKSILLEILICDVSFMSEI